MAYEEFLHSISLDADASVGIFTGVPGIAGGPANNSGVQYRFVKPVGEHQVGLVAAATDTVIGVLQNKPQGTGHAATIGISGVSKVEAGGAIAAGANVVTDTSGRAVAAGTAGAGTAVLGTAVHSSAVAGELIPVLLRLT